ncbi:MAG: RNA ligase partner protein [Candidatus Omnitrophica bacterium]|nr:RNA ligase partner protein [Candidatus Omnitrophota bacterium]
MSIIKVVLDTNIFVNPASYKFFGDTPSNAFNNFLNLISNKKNISCYMPPSVYKEFLKFLDNEVNYKNTTFINKKPPSSYQLSLSAILFYEFIEQIRIRINKGLRIAEKYTRKGLQGGSQEQLIRSLREEYRTQTREGIIDSKEDFDLILLSKELEALLATSDEGLIIWAHKLGINCIDACQLKEILEKTN